MSLLNEVYDLLNKERFAKLQAYLTVLMTVAVIGIEVYQQYQEKQLKE